MSSVFWDLVVTQMGISVLTSCQLVSPEVDAKVSTLLVIFLMYFE